MAGVDMKKLLAAAVVVLALPFFPSRAFACSCAGGTPLCQSFWQADAVFSGEVLSFGRTEREQPLSSRVARVAVVRAWRGQVSGTVEVLTGADSASCGYSFRPGTQYLIYAYRTKDGALTTSICSPTKELSKAAADLEYVKGTGAPSAGGRIYGTARFEAKGSPLAPAKNVNINLQSTSGSRTAVTDDTGAFEFKDLPAGEYSIVMERAPFGPRKVELRDVHACVAVNLWALPPAKHP
jgi:hypothetical protein